MGILAVVFMLSSGAWAESAFTVRSTKVHDEKAVFATVESVNVIPARVRTGGTIVDLSLKEGAHVDRGQVVATVGDEKIALQINAFDSRMAGYASRASRPRRSWIG
jgi:multidrug efflux pump subunit AcrA (membrane-fusion protein)